MIMQKTDGQKPSVFLYNPSIYISLLLEEAVVETLEA